MYFNNIKISLFFVAFLSVLRITRCFYDKTSHCMCHFDVSLNVLRYKMYLIWCHYDGVVAKLQRSYAHSRTHSSALKEMAVFTHISCTGVFTSSPKAVHTCADNIIQVCILCQFNLFNIRHFDEKPILKALTLIRNSSYQTCPEQDMVESKKTGNPH